MVLFTLEKNNMIDDIFAKFDGAFAKNTIRAYRSDFIQYQTWCSHNNIDSIPATAEAIAQYVDYLATIRKSATIRRRINSLGTVLKLSKHYDPTNQPEVILAIKRMHRKIGRAQQQATPITKPLLNQLLSNCDNSLRGLRNKVLLRLGYETMRRRSELCAKDLKMDSDEQPLIGHSFRVGAALDLLAQGESLERIMLRGGWQADSTAMSYLRNWIV